jgi:hypothetical protein
MIIIFPGSEPGIVFYWSNIVKNVVPDDKSNRVKLWKI